jgi:hypothetical protein
MPKSYRVRTQIGVDKYINLKLEQDFETLEILSLKINQSDIYTRVCSDYGVIVGRVFVNGGYGLPNAKVSVFIPLTDADELNPVISELYPYRSLSTLNESGYRYNLLPKEPSYPGHSSTGSFPSKEEILIDQTYIEVYDKYYKFTVKTNDSGDYMIFGVPTGTQSIFMDVDLSDMGCFSLSPQDLIRTGQATETQLNGTTFKSSTDLNELPQIKTLNKNIEVSPLWGEDDICQIGITRVDFDLTTETNVRIEPTAIFMGSIVSTSNEDYLSTSCVPKLDMGNLCDLVAGPGQILSIRQTIKVDEFGDPILEQYVLENDGKIIDENGTWLANLPMNLDYITTDEFGNQVLSNDPNVGIPTKGKYRFKVKWQNETGNNNNFVRASYLVPNIREYGWDSPGLQDPSNNLLTTYIADIPVPDYEDSLTIVGSGDLLGPVVLTNVTAFNVFIQSNPLANQTPYFGDPTIGITGLNNNNVVNIIFTPTDPTLPASITYPGGTLGPVTFSIPPNTISIVWGVFSQGGLVSDTTTNVQSYIVEIGSNPFGPWTLYTGSLNSIPVNTGDYVRITPTAIDINQPQQVVYSYGDQYYFDYIKSYAFSLDWDDYVDKNVAINCEDTFYLFNYNKVYTVSSFIDRYKKGKNKDRHLGIKEITDRRCQTENNKFPVNDLQRNFDFIEFVVALVLNILTIPIIAIITLAHFLIVLWPIVKWFLVVGVPIWLGYNIMEQILTAISAYPAVFLIIAAAAMAILYIGLLIAFIIYVIPRLVNWNTFNKIGLPMLTYPDCDACPCEQIPILLEEPDPDLGEGTLDRNNSFLSDVTASYLYKDENKPCNPRNPYQNRIDDDTPQISIDASNQFYRLFSGIDAEGNPRRGMMSFITKDPQRWGFPITEHWPNKLNRFNLRNTYFEGHNWMRVFVNNSVEYFEDQPMVIVVDWNLYQAFNPGEMITFQKPSMSGDVDRITGLTDSSGATLYNQFGCRSITGTTLNQGLHQVDIEYANRYYTPGSTTEPPNRLTQITITASTQDGSYRFPADLEYFQVITGMSMSEFIDMSDTTSSGFYPKEYLNHIIKWRYRAYNGNDVYEQQARARDNFYDSDNLGILILNRGIDPYTDRQLIKYDIGILFGRQFGEVSVVGNYKLNYPIRRYTTGSNYDPAVHNTPTNLNYFSSGNGGRSVYHKSFSFTPDTTLFGQYTNTQSTMPYYYSSLDSQNSGLEMTSVLPFLSPPYILQPSSQPLTGMDTTVFNTDSQIDFNNNPQDTNKVLPYKGVTTETLSTDLTGTCGGTADGWTTGQYIANRIYFGGGSFIQTFELYLGDTQTTSSPPPWGGWIPPGYVPIPTQFPINDGLRGTTDSFTAGAPRIWYLCSPAYISYFDIPSQPSIPNVNCDTSSVKGINFNDRFGIVMRSDRLPTSTNLESKGPYIEGYHGDPYTKFVLHENNSFIYYKIPDEGLCELIFEFSLQSDIPNEILPDSGIPPSIAGSLTCEGMTELSCYEGYGTGFTVNETCANKDKVINGCYYLLNEPYVTNIGNDITLFLEWKARFRIMYAACRGVFSHMFQNNWVNGTLYMPTFNKLTLYDELGQFTEYNYCDEIITYNTASNSFFYRSSPYVTSPSGFIGSSNTSPGDISVNRRQIKTPTTIMDLGKRDAFISFICSNSEFSGEYLSDTLTSTSYNDSSLVLQLGIISRLINSTWLQQLFNTNDASVQQYFSRSGSRIDGDIAQSMSINSEYEINPFVGTNYPDQFIWIGSDNTNKPVFGVFYNTSEQQYKNRRALSPGFKIYSFSPLLQDLVPYNSTQEVPLYKWRINANNSIFGNENNNWVTGWVQNSRLTSRRYQMLDTDSNIYPINYFQTSTMTSVPPNLRYGFITNIDSTGNPITNGTPLQNEIIVGAPYHFYFGLKNGKTAVNRFIKLYVNTLD